jgi:plastocyanin/outer membrane murein-binding lipoprotein Lpp
VNNHKKVLLTKVLVIGAVLMPLLLLSGAHAETQQSVDLEDMRREIRQLRSQVQALRAALSEAAELDSQRAAMLSRTLRAIPSSEPTASKGRDDAEKTHAAPAASPTPVPVIVPATPPPPPAVARTSRRGSEAGRRAADSPAAGGIVRGKVGVPKGEPVAYVYVENVSAPAVRDQRVVIEQIGKKFVPSWAVVQRGTSILFPNRDNIYHNVFSLSSGNSFDLGLYSSSGEPKSYTFNEAGEVEIYCNIHPQMSASTLVVPNRLFAKVKSDGTFEIPGVPSGKRKIVAWAPGSRLAATWVDVESGDAAQVDLRLEPKSSSHKNKSGQQYGSYE